ncbi:MAG: hypothetical protein FH753_12595 [Firmicutes bacterium]|nr:hypothetical protein [Bacillota bacterium]
MKNLIFDYIKALVNLYGIVPKKKVVEIFNMQNKEKINGDDIKKILIDETLEDEFFDYIGKNFVHESVFIDNSYHNLLKEQEGKPYYIPKKKELLKYKDDLYYERTKEFRKLKRYIDENMIRDEKKAEEICDDIQLICEVGFSMDDVFFEFERRGINFESEQQIKELAPFVINLSNNTRIWTNRGHTPEEMYKTIQKRNKNFSKNKEKIGRNDPCPCGSGIKYKKCCYRK